MRLSGMRPGGVWRAGVLAGLAVLTLLCGVGVLLAPVIADDPVVTWPRAGEQPRSTVLPLVPYRPLSLDATVPCAALAALDRDPDGGDALRTVPAAADDPRRVDRGEGLVVAARHGIVSVTASGTVVLQEFLPGPGCTYRILADGGGVRVLRDGVPQATKQVQVPEVGELATDVEGRPVARGLRVSLHTDARYESRPTALKIGLLVAHGAALAALLVVAWRWYGDRQGYGRRRAPTARPRPRIADAVLVLVCAVWVLLAPTNFDDPWYLLMARGANASGSVGNAIYMFNVTENPFVASQYVLQAWGWLGGLFGANWGLAWMRLVPLIYGLITWVLLRRLLVTGFGPELGTGRAVWALLVAYLLWWLPYGMTLRPEPLIVLLAAATLLLAESARRQRSVGALAAATATAALAMSVSPSGLVAAAPLIMAVPWLWRWLREQAVLARVAAVAVLVAAGTSLVLVGFADNTLGDVLESVAVHQWYYHTFSWYQEYVHYQTILRFKDSAQWARRAPVVLTLAVLLVVAVATRRRTTDDDPVRRLLVSSAISSAIALALLAPTPTKFVNHFGAVAAAPTMLLAAALLRSPLLRAWRLSWRQPEGQLSWRQPEGWLGWRQPEGWLSWRSFAWPPDRRRLHAITVGATVAVVCAVALSLSGPNLWRPYSDRGQPFGDHLTAARERVDLAAMQPALGPVRLGNPLLWIVIASAVAYWWWRRRDRDTELTPDRVVLAAGATTMVVMTLVVFIWAPLRQYPGWSVALSSAHAARGEPCLLADYIQVLTGTPAPPVPGGTAIAAGAFAAAATEPAPVPAPSPGTLVWHDAAEDGPQTGWLITPWFTVAADAGATHLLIPLIGTREDQQLTLQYATEAGNNPSVAGSVTLPADDTVSATQWQQAAVPLHQLGRSRPSAVRMVLHDRVSDQEVGDDSWLAVGQPRLARWRPLSALATGRAAYVDQVTATFLPCLDQVAIAHGIAGAPEVLVLGDEGFRRHFLDLGFEDLRGGTQVPVDQSATTVRVPSRLMPAGPPTLPWGRVERVVHDHPVALVDLHITQRQRPGWTRLPTLATETYQGDLS